MTRFPPEPNGYLHIGHAKSICLNFGIAEQYGGRCNLRFDDTNPEKEDVEYVEAIKHDVRWLGFAYGDQERSTPRTTSRRCTSWPRTSSARARPTSTTRATRRSRTYRGSLSEPGRPSPYRDRSVEENLALFRQMRAGELPDGTCVLRARIDLAAANMKMRDPLLYRIRHAHHYRTGDAWCIYPMYDYAHPLERRHRGHHPLDLHPRVREQPRALRLGDRPTPARPSAAGFARPSSTSSPGSTSTTR